MISILHLIQLAWKNIWRRKARTIISISSLWFTITIIIFSKSMMDGTYGMMIENTINRFVSYIQIHDVDWSKEKTISNSMTWNKTQSQILNKSQDIIAFSPRIITVGLLGFGDQTRGIQIVGIDPVKESNVTNFIDKVTKGEFFKQDTSSYCVIGEKLANKMKVTIGDTLVVMSFDRYGSISAILSPISGIIMVADPKMDEFSIFISLEKAKELTSLYNHISEVAIKVDESDYESVLNDLQTEFTSNYIVEGWEKLSPDVLQLISMDKASAVFSMFLLLLIVGFGILNTIYMGIMERTHEFGIMQAIGVHRFSIVSLAFVEIIFLLAISSIISTVFSSPFLYYLSLNPIEITGQIAEAYSEMGISAVWYFDFTSSPFILANGFVIGISLILSVFPLMKLKKMNVVEALRNV
jgi:putative ABC transport system permease protein